MYCKNTIVFNCTQDIFLKKKNYVSAIFVCQYQMKSNSKNLFKLQVQVSKKIYASPLKEKGY